MSSTKVQVECFSFVTYQRLFQQFFKTFCHVYWLVEALLIKQRYRLKNRLYRFLSANIIIG